MSYQTPWHDKDPGAYGHLLINRIVSGLAGGELGEYRTLQRIKRRKRSAEQQARMEQLWEKASDLDRARRSTESYEKYVAWMRLTRVQRVWDALGFKVLPAKDHDEGLRLYLEE
jgi:hypothetical protein